MVTRTICPACKGNKYVSVTRADGKRDHRRCPECGGAGYKVRIVHDPR
ncbi:hypothetical protein MX659_01405 [Coriobacteriia bacterium Es71-Z0120]|jgi:Zn ribbon nucleic-acid-binding protein|nr:hypothetical protein [Parvivirga hydrogeniphila]MCL4078267.1 hypothetical protein [Parvivirga hydrogeniphila]